MFYLKICDWLVFRCDLTLFSSTVSLYSYTVVFFCQKEISNASEKDVKEWGMRVAVFSFFFPTKTKQNKTRKEELDQEWLPSGHLPAQS